jgi:hypothetical protein
MSRAAKSNDEYRAYLNKIMPLYLNFTVSASIIKHIHENINLASGGGHGRDT